MPLKEIDKLYLKACIPFCLFWAAFFMIMLFMFGCNTAKKTILKDNSALERVKAKRSLIDSVSKTVFELYPCANDTVTEVINGGVDSIPYPVPVPDTSLRGKIIDSLKESYSKECYLAVELSYDAGYNNALIGLKNQKLAVKRPDTLINTVLDKQKANQQVIAINNLEKKLASAEGVISQLEKTVEQRKSDYNSLFWYLVAAISLLLVSNAAWIYFKIKNPLKWTK